MIKTTYDLRVKDGPGKADLTLEGTGVASIVWHELPEVPKHVYVPRNLQNLMQFTLSYSRSGEGSLSMRLQSGVSTFDIVVENTTVEG
jgi:hypothetical protein